VVAALALASGTTPAVSAAATLAGGTAGAAAAAGTAPAQSPAAENQLEEIVVTALKRDQRLQDVPASLTAFTAEAITRQNITRPIDFINATPNLSAVEANNAGDLRITIRGDAQALNTDAPVAVVIDGVVLTGPTGLNKDLLDVQQIEVLKGPQGYLYGRNAISGAINIVTQAPTDTLQGRARITAGNGATVGAAASLSGPIVADRLGFSAAFGYRDSEGFYRNLTTGFKVDPYNEKSGRVRFDWKLTDALKAQASVFVSRIDGSATNYLSQSLFPGLQTSSPIVDADYADAPFVANIRNFNDKRDDLVSLRFDYDREWGRITSVSSYEHQNNIFASDGYPYTPGNGEGTQWNQREHTAYTTELRYTSPSDRALRWIAGAYYADISETPFLLAAVGVDDSGFVRRDAPPIRSGFNQTTGFSADDVDGEVWAGFANVDWDLTDAVTLTLAGRYDREKKTAEDVAFGTSSVTGLPFSATAGQKRSDTFKKFQPKASIAWKITPEASLYATYAVGFKAGGFNAIQAFQITGGRAPSAYPAEQAKNFEIGAKSQWLDRRLTLNAALFHTEKDNSQLFQFIPQGFLNAVTVIDQIKVKGGELEIAARPVDEFTVRAGIGYTNAEIDEYRANPQFVGNDAPYVPDLKTSLDATWERPVTAGLNFVANARWDHIGKISFDAANSPLAQRSALDLFSARFALEGERWSLALWGKNLSDERYNSDVIVIFTGDPLPFTQAVFKAPPRTYGIELSMRW
jgi:iron complex outermembrane receptor protein